MTVTFYKTSDDPRKIDKTITAVKSNVSCDVFGDTSMLSPTLICDYDDDLFEANYMYVSTWNRYYYIEPSVLRGNHILISGNVDVLKSFSTQIKALNCTVVRTAKNGKSNLYLDDGKFKILNYPRIQTKKFPNSLSKNLSYVLTIAGGS